jgi:diadenosine tetraphosphate (Ap4A) HIT family hydrolase
LATRAIDDGGRLRKEGEDLSTCDFCDELSRGNNNVFASFYGTSMDRAIWQSEDLTIVPTIGQIVEGHVLILPKKHITAFGDASARMIQGLTSVKHLLKEILLRRYGGCIFFEHGTRSDHCGGCGIYHAHMHALPIPYDSNPVGLLKDISFLETENLQSAFAKINRESSYLFFENTSSRCFVAEVSYLPSQTFRRAVANLAGNPVWDWRAHKIEPALLKSWETLKLEFEHLR